MRLGERAQSTCSRADPMKEPGLRLRTMVPEFLQRSRAGVLSRFSPQKETQARGSAFPLSMPSSKGMGAGSRSNRNPATAQDSRCGSRRFESSAQENNHSLRDIPDESDLTGSLALV